MDARDEPPDAGRLERVAPGAGGRRPLIPAVAIVAALLIGALRPWDLFGGPAGGPGRDGSGSDAGFTDAPGAPARGSLPGEQPGVTPVGSPSPDQGLDLSSTCGWPSGWRAATLQVWLGRAGTIRSWIATDPIAATGPLDPRIPFSPVATDLVTALGYCAPLEGGPQPPATARASLWAIRSGAAIPLTPVVLEPAEPNALGGLWRPAPEVGVVVHGRPAWATGRYVIEVRSPDGTFDRWLGIEIEDLGARRGEPSATASPRPASPRPASPVPTPGTASSAPSAAPSAKP